MYQFITSLLLEILFLIAFTYGIFVALGKIKPNGWTTEEFEDWRRRNGRYILMICIGTLMVIGLSIMIKYDRFQKTVANQGEVITPYNDLESVH